MIITVTLILTFAVLILIIVPAYALAFAVEQKLTVFRENLVPGQVVKYSSEFKLSEGIIKETFAKEVLLHDTHNNSVHLVQLYNIYNN